VGRRRDGVARGRDSRGGSTGDPDQPVDRRLARDIEGHDVTTAPDAGGAGLTNGELLSRAQHEFDAFVLSPDGDAAADRRVNE
jgi:hypothetical protein